MKRRRRSNISLLILSIFFHLQLSLSSGKSDGVCVSKGGRFPPFSSAGKPPAKVKKGSKDLTLCRVFRQRTCCDVAQTYPASLSIRRLASTGEANEECLHLWELLECSICDPRVGVIPGSPLICDSFCDRVYEACLGAYFSMDVTTRVLAPCGLNDFLCGKVAEWVPNGTELCHAAGFTVKKDVSSGVVEAFCYGGQGSLDSISSSWKSSRTQQVRKAQDITSLEDFKQWVQEMPFKDKVSWAVGGMVLTAGLLFVSQRKSYTQRQKLAAIQRKTRQLGAEIGQKSPESRGNRKVHQR